MTEHHLGIFLFQVLLLLGLARGFGGVLRRFGHPPVVGEIAIGLLLGPTLLGRAWPELQQAIFPPDVIQQAMLDTVSGSACCCCCSRPASTSTCPRRGGTVSRGTPPRRAPQTR